ncbi:MAG: hypothetical protein ABF254_00760 [Octadecabacter sp.]
MPKFTIDSIEYNSEDLSEDGQAHMTSLRFLEYQIQKIKDEIKVYQVARESYLGGLKSELAKLEDKPEAAGK